MFQSVDVGQLCTLHFKKLTSLHTGAGVYLEDHTLSTIDFIEWLFV